MSVDMNDGDGLAPVEMNLEVPARLVRDYQALVETGVYLSVPEALRATLVTGWRYDKGSYHSIRLDVAGDSESASADNEGEQGAADTTAKG